MDTLGKLIGAVLGVILGIMIVLARLCPIVFVVFLILKLCAVITFSWFWVCFPLIIAGVVWVAWVFIAALGSKLQDQDTADSN